MAETTAGEAIVAGETHAGTGADGYAAEAKASWLAFDATGWVAIAMLALLGIMLWKGVFRGIGTALDAKIARIRSELAEAEKIRAEAEALRAEMIASRAAAEADAAKIRAGAEREAQAILKAADAEAERRVARRAQAAEERIAAAERAAEADLRARAAVLATEAARRVIAGGRDSDLAATLTDKAIAEVGHRL